MTFLTALARPRLLLAFSVVFGLSLSGGPLGSSAEAMQLTPQQKQEMKLRYEKATRAYDVGKYNEAVDEYQKAYEIGGDPAMLYNIGQAYRLGDQPGEAIRFYRRYLQRSPNARNREDVERRIVELEKIVEARKQAPVVAPPPPVVTAPAPTPPPAQTPPPPSLATTPPPPVPTDPPVESDGSGRRIAGYVLLGVGAVAAGFAGYEGNLARQKSDKISAMSKDGEVFDPAVETNGKRANVLFIVSGIAAVGALVAGGVLLLTGGSSSAAEEPPPSPTGAPAVVPVVGAGVVGAAASWSF